MVHFEAKKHGIEGLTDLPKPMEILKEQWYRVLPLVVIIVLMLIGYSPGYSAFWATLSYILVSWVKKETRMGPNEILDAILRGARNTLVIGATVGVIGVIVGSIALTPSLLTDVVGIGMAVLLWWWQKRKNRPDQLKQSIVENSQKATLRKQMFWIYAGTLYSKGFRQGSHDETCEC